MATTKVTIKDGFDAYPSSMWAWVAVFLLIGALMVVLYDRPLIVLGRYFNEPEYSHGYLIPLITIFFLWNRRHGILAERDTGSWWGVALALLAAILFVIGLLAAIIRLPGLSFVLMLLAIGYAALGRRAMRRAALPIAFLLVAMPLPGLVFVMLSTELQLISSRLGAWMLQAMGVSVFVGGNIIDLGVFKMQVAEACSGLRYLFPLGAFAFLCAWLMRAPLWMRGVVLLSSLPLTIVLNSARIAMTGLFLEYGNVEMAEGFMHLFEGWVVFIVALTILFLLMWALCRLAGNRLGVLDVLDFDRIQGPPARPSSRVAAWPTLPLLAVVVVMAGTVVLQPIVESREQYHPSRPGLVTFPMAVGDWRGTPQLIDVETERALRATDYLLADFTDNSGETVNFWVAYYANQVNRAAIHSPKECLPGAGWEYVTLETIDAPVDPYLTDPFELNRGIIANGEQRMLIYYWADMRDRRLTNDVTLKLYNLYDSVMMGRSDGALVRLLTPIALGESEEAADARMRDFLMRAYPHLQPHVGS